MNTSIAPAPNQRRLPWYVTTAVLLGLVAILCVFMLKDFTGMVRDDPWGVLGTYIGVCVGLIPLVALLSAILCWFAKRRGESLSLPATLITVMSVLVCLGSVGSIYGNHKGGGAAIELAKHARTLSKERSNEDEIRRDIEGSKADIRLLGWEAARARDGAYLVTFSLVVDGVRRSYFFEVLTDAKTVRNVFASNTLLEQYGLTHLILGQAEPKEIKAIRSLNGDNVLSDGALLFDWGNRTVVEERWDVFAAFSDSFRYYVLLFDFWGGESLGHRVKPCTLDEFKHELVIRKKRGDFPYVRK